MIQGLLFVLSKYDFCNGASDVRVAALSENASAARFLKELLQED
jgi:hypothetical protein